MPLTTANVGDVKLVSGFANCEWLNALKNSARNSMLIFSRGQSNSTAFEPKGLSHTYVQIREEKGLEIGPACLEFVPARWQEQKGEPSLLVRGGVLYFASIILGELSNHSRDTGARGVEDNTSQRTGRGGLATNQDSKAQINRKAGPELEGGKREHRFKPFHISRPNLAGRPLSRHTLVADFGQKR